jgi:hypothetical protein
MKKTLLCAVAVAATLALTGCAITDFTGYPNHKTTSEAKLWAQEISFIAGDPALDGTYAYTVKYDSTKPGYAVTILSYRNPVPNSFSRDGVVDRDGDDVQGRSGTLGGKFLIRFVAVDTDPTLGNCGFFDNITQDKTGGAGLLTALCATTNEEIDKDADLQASFSSFDDLLGRIWSGALTGGFTADLTGIRVNGVSVPLSQPLSLGAKSNGVRPMQFSIDLTQPGGQALIQALLANTSSGVPVSLGLEFDGGLSFDLPGNVKAVFNHDKLFNLL